MVMVQWKFDPKCFSAIWRGCHPNTNPSIYVLIGVLNSSYIYLNTVKFWTAWTNCKDDFRRPKHGRATNANVVLAVFEGLPWPCVVIYAKYFGVFWYLTKRCPRMQNSRPRSSIFLEILRCEYWCRTKWRNFRVKNDIYPPYWTIFIFKSTRPNTLKFCKVSPR